MVHVKLSIVNQNEDCCQDSISENLPDKNGG
jgi:hypothetical protein